jgi:hypothetical protein
MTQLSQMFKESNIRMKMLMDYLAIGTRKPDMEVIAAAQRDFEGQIKSINLAISGYAVESKNRRALKGMKRMNIMDDTTAIDLMLGDPNDDKVKCPSYNQLITRAECLDISGSGGDDCPGCEIGLSTKHKLLPPADYIG